MGRCELDLSSSVQAPVAGCCEHRNEHLGSIKYEKFTSFSLSRKTLPRGVNFSDESLL
jgi:hypothetical protein